MPPIVPPAFAALPPLDRRTLLRAGALGGGLVAAAPLAAQASARGFTHGVASGEPGPREVLLWTRYAGGAASALTYEVSETLDFTKVVAGGTVTADPARDFCAKPVATGLAPDRWYYYRFIAPDGTASDIGRTRTLPEGPAARWRMAVFSCSNLGFGWFNAYAHAAAEDAFDCVLHLGDYLYEYPAGTYPGAAQVLPGRSNIPPHEIVALADYRARYAQYRNDPDLRRLHQIYPMISVADDHETANDAYRDGAENHQPESEGSWDARKAAAVQARGEWLPISDAPWARYQVGDLATLFRLETRLTARDKPFSFGALMAGKSREDALASLQAFRDGAWHDPARELLGAAQQAWLGEGLAASRRAGTRWQVLVQQVLMGTVATPQTLAAALPEGTPDYVRRRVESGAVASDAALPLNMDAWDGYPAARARVFAAALEAGTDLISLAGDTHNAWAFDLDHGSERVGVEFAGQSVSSPGFEGYLAAIPSDRLAAALVERNAQLKWADTARRGYMAVELTPGTATSEYRMLDGVRSRSARLAATHRVMTRAGARQLETG